MVNKKHIKTKNHLESRSSMLNVREVSINIADMTNVSDASTNNSNVRFCESCNIKVDIIELVVDLLEILHNRIEQNINN